MKIHCFTNRDDFQNHQWPTSLPSAPEKGDRIRSKSGAVLVVVVGRTWLADGTLVLELHR